MGMSNFSGPLIVTPAGQPANPAHPGPSQFDRGVALLDGRVGYSTGQSELNLVPGFPMGYIPVLDQAPAASNTNNVAVAQAAINGTSLTFLAASAGVVTVGVSLQSLLNKKTVSGLIALDGISGTVGFGGLNAPSVAYDPTRALSRNIVITSTGNDSAGYFIVNGYDIYGQPMSEKIVGGNASTVNGRKAFKYLASVIPTGVSGGNVSLGVGSNFGFPLRMNQFPYADIYWNGSLITANTGFTAADTTNPATNVTGDVRGTYAVQSAPDGAKKLQVFIKPEVAMLALGPVGLFGSTQA